MRVAGGERDEQPADALGDDDVGAQRRARRPREQPAGSRAVPGELGGQVRRDRRAEAMRRDLAGGATRRRGEQLVIGGAAGLRLVEPGDDRLERGDVARPSARSAAASAAASTVLPTPGVGAGDEEAAHARARLRGLALDVERARRTSRGGVARGRHRARPRPGGSRPAARRGRARARPRAARPCVCEAITARRRRDVPSGTVGGRIAWANTPRSIASSQIRIACSASPTTSGTIWVVEPATSKPSRASSSRSASPLACRRSTRCGLLGEQLERRQRPGHRRRRRRGREDERPRAC